MVLGEHNKTMESNEIPLPFNPDLYATGAYRRIGHTWMERVPYNVFHLPAALKGANLITRDGRCVTQFKPNPDHVSPKAYIAMVGDDLMYYHPSGCVNRSCEPHPLDLFIKIN